MNPRKTMEMNQKKNTKQSTKKTARKSIYTVPVSLKLSEGMNRVLEEFCEAEGYGTNPAEKAEMIRRAIATLINSKGFRPESQTPRPEPRHELTISESTLARIEDACPANINTKEYTDCLLNAALAIREHTMRQLEESAA